MTIRVLALVLFAATASVAVPACGDDTECIYDGGDDDDDDDDDDGGPDLDSGPGLEGDPGLDSGPGPDGGPGLDSGPGPEGGPDLDSGPGLDGGPDLDGGPGLDAPPSVVIVVPEAVGSLDLPFSMSAVGEGTNRIGVVNLPGGVGTVEIHGRTLPALVHEQQQWPRFGYTLYQTIAIADDAWYVLWLYCTSADALVHIYLVGTDGTTLDSESATGTCTVAPTPSTIDVAFPAIDLAIGPLVEGFTAIGPELMIASGAPGSIVLAVGTMEVLPFGVVDCTTLCGPTPWYELHVILWDEANRRASFAIFYLNPEQPETIALTYSLTLPDLENLIGYISLDATWTYDR
jgi:hypothetical protein